MQENSSQQRDKSRMLIPDKVRAEIATLDTLIADTRNANEFMETQRGAIQTLVNQLESGVSAKDMYFGFMFRKNKETVRAVKALRHERYVLDEAVKKNRERLPKYEQALSQTVGDYLSANDERYQGLQRTADEIFKLLTAGKILKNKTKNAIDKNDYESYVPLVVINDESKRDKPWIKEIKDYKRKFEEMVDICNEYMSRQAGLPFEKRKIISGNELQQRFELKSSSKYERDIRAFDGFMSEINTVMEYQLNHIQTMMDVYARQVIAQCRADLVEVK